jgi:hypothetical protein
MYTTYAPFQNLIDAARGFVATAPKTEAEQANLEPLNAALGLITQLEAEKLQYSEEILYARECYAEPSEDDLEIDEEPLLSVGEGGIWVSAWVWVADADSDENEQDDSSEGDTARL